MKYLLSIITVGLFLRLQQQRKDMEYLLKFDERMLSMYSREHKAKETLKYRLDDLIATTGYKRVSEHELAEIVRLQIHVLESGEWRVTGMGLTHTIAALRQALRQRDEATKRADKAREQVA